MKSFFGAQNTMQCRVNIYAYSGIAYVQTLDLLHAYKNVHTDAVINK